jgi:hypothetical protein
MRFPVCTRTHGAPYAPVVDAATQGNAGARSSGPGALLSTGTWRVAGLLNFPLLRPWQRKPHSTSASSKSNPNFKQQTLKTQGR